MVGIPQGECGGGRKYARCIQNDGENVVVYVSHTTGLVCTRLAKDFFGKVESGANRFEFVASALG